VIVPAYNAATTVGMAVDSVLAQTYGDFELLVIDDGSTDSTSQEVRSRDDDRLRCVETENHGVARARNHGLDLSSGEFVAFLDADDAWLPTKLERQLDLMIERPTVGLCFTSAEVVDGEVRRIGEDSALSFRDYTQALLIRGNVVAGSASAAMVRRSLLETTGGFDPQLSQCADWDLWLRLSLEAELDAIGEPLVQIRKAFRTMSSDPALLEKDTFALLDKFFATEASTPYRPFRRRAYAAQWMVCAGTYLHAGRLRDALRCVRRGLFTDPRSLPRPLLLPVRVGSRVWRSRLQRG
jgi:glycosyltransferase involved in cell wall biosynthesis